MLDNIKNLLNNSSKLKWLHKKPHKELCKKLEGQIKDINEESTSVMCLDFYTLEKLLDYRISFNDIKRERGLIYKDQHVRQFITSVSVEENELVEEALKFKKPIETLKISVITTSRDEFSSEIIYGESNSISSVQQLESIIQGLIYNIRTTGFEVEKIIIGHVHPSLEVILKSEDKHSFITNGLSKRDINTAKHLKERFKYPLEMSAYLPSGLKYSSYF